MPIALAEMPVAAVWRNPPRRAWTRRERERLEELGLLERERWELIEGDLLAKLLKRRPHVPALTILTRWLMGIFAERVNTPAPLDVSPEDNPTSQPEPDVMVLRAGYGDPWQAVPGPADVELAVEVSDTTAGIRSDGESGIICAGSCAGVLGGRC
jgi:hypothetical protein